MKKALILSLLFCLLGCDSNQSAQQSVVIEMEQMFDLGWEEVIEIKNCGDNYQMAQEIIEGLNLVNEKYGRTSRNYRINP